MSPKRITQPITMILVAALTIAIPIAMALIMKFLTITAWIDYLFRINLVLFWAVMVVSRLGFAFLWGFIDYIVVDQLEKWGWLWFAPSGPFSGKGEPSKDYSGVVVVVVVGTCLAFVVAEEIIHFFIPETPPFWFWPWFGN